MFGDSGAEPLVVARGFTVTYGDATAENAAVKSVDFRIDRGEQVALVGESGSGKTTLALALAGFLTEPSARVTADTLTFDGAPLDRSATRRLPVRTPGISMVFQDAMTSLDPVWTIENQLRGVIRHQHRSSRQKLARSAERALAIDWLHRVGLTDTDRVLAARPYELSGGMRQRVMLALALCAKPALLVADEPTSALDVSLSRSTMDLLAELTRDEQVSLLIVSHDINLCLEYSDRTLVMYRGELVEQGVSATLGHEATHPYTRGLLHCVPTLDSSDWEELPTLDSYLAGAAGSAVSAGSTAHSPTERSAS
ncbi:ABC transporter ATP-binding protein [Herbiconiux sp. P15]|uniref:ABC transporter ATP-binding protein n=1 Tax=Herbiconiux liukaitaii TaxID=3342799 RepID=UPI0035B9F4E4